MISGRQFKDMIISAANNIENYKQSVNDLNVFPVPDGDTGTNMSLTIRAAKEKLMTVDSDNLSEVADIVAMALIKGARGNSGVILSLFFRGIASGLKGLESANSTQFASALNKGVQSGYKAVMKPTEGTILTVARVGAEKLNAYCRNPKPMADAFEYLIAQSEITLAQTPELLPVLKQAKVVDAGGKGYIYILSGMLSVLKTGEIIQLKEAESFSETISEERADFSSFETGDIKFQYCTEFLLYKNQPEKENEGLEEYLMSIGDSLVYVDTGEFVKIHVHTNNPGKAMEKALLFGDLDKLKIENMKIQHTDMSNAPKKEEKAEVDRSGWKQYGFVSVCAGEGLKEVFKDLAVDEVINGGQTMNPSTDEILSAVEKVEAHNVFVLPNNKNIIMAAEQAAPLCDKNVIVIPTKTVPQGLNALFNFNPDADVEENAQAMISAIDNVKTASVTFAARDSVYKDKEIKKDQILGLMESKVTFVTDSTEECIEKIAYAFKEENCTYITVFYGEGVSEEEANKSAEAIQKIIGDDLDISVINGGQPVYYYIISAE